MSLTTGVLLLPTHASNRFAELAQLAERTDYDVLWLADECFFREVYASLTLAGPAAEVAAGGTHLAHSGIAQEIIVPIAPDGAYSRPPSRSFRSRSCHGCAKSWHNESLPQHAWTSKPVYEQSPSDGAKVTTSRSLGNRKCIANISNI